MSKGTAGGSNPFKPTFGTSPPVLVGRDAEVRAFELALSEGPGALGRATLYTGPRGVGKTVMLNEVHDAALARGWLVISETATAGLIDRIRNDHIPAALASLSGHDGPARRLTGLSLPGGLGSASWENTTATPPRSLRAALDELVAALAPHDTGVLVTVDELHAGDIEELRELTTTIQHAFRAEHNVAFVGAGLPRAVSSLLNDQVLTFLRRADRHQLGKVNEIDVRDGIEQPIADQGRQITSDALDLAVEATNGYPFMIQLVGAHLWRSTDAPTIDREAANAGIGMARRQLGRLVVEPALQDLSPTDRTFLLAMAQYPGPAKLGDIAERLGVTTNYASQYRQRLIDAEIITPTRHGHVDFTMPAIGDYLREHAAHEIQANLTDPNRQLE